MAKVYRFHNVVGLNTDSGTVYIPPSEARKLYNDLKKVLDSVRREPFAQSSASGRDVADYGFAPDAHNVAALLGDGRIKTREVKPGVWRGYYRLKVRGRFKSVANGDGKPIAYARHAATHRR